MADTFSQFGGLKGLSTYPPAELVDRAHFTRCDNVVHEGGSIRCRPGYLPVFNGVGVDVLTQLKDRDLAKYLCADTSISPNRLYWNTLGAIYSGTTDNATETLYESGASTQLHGMTTDGNYLYVCDITNKCIRRGTLAVTGTTSSFINMASLDSGARPLFIAAASSYLLVVWQRGDLSFAVTRFNRNTGALVDTLMTNSYYSLSDIGNCVWNPDASCLYLAVRYTIIEPLHNVYAVWALSLLGVPTLIATLNTASIRALAYDGTNRRLIVTQNDFSATATFTAYDVVQVSTGDIATTNQGSSNLYTTKYPTNPQPIAGVSTTFSPEGVIYLDSTSSTYVSSNSNTIGGVYEYEDDSSVLTSAYWLGHSRVGLEDALATDDVVLMQYQDLASGGGSRFRAWFPGRGSSGVLAINPGFDAGAGRTPNVWAMQSRTVTGGVSEPLISAGNYGRASFAFQGGCFDTLQGGVLTCANHPGHVFSYGVAETAQSEIQTLAFATSTATGGSFTLSLDNTNSTAAIAYNASAATVQTRLEALAVVGAGNVAVTGSDLPGGTLTITWQGALANKALPVLRYANSLTMGAGDPQTNIVLTRTQRGIESSDPGTLLMRPIGLPTPTTPTVTAFTAANGALTGYYEYVITYASSRLKIESYPSAKSTATLASAGYLTVQWTLPTTLWFDTRYTSGAVTFGPLVDKVRIYRRRAGVTSTDGTGGELPFQIVAEVNASDRYYADSLPDSSRGADYAPFDNAYPPTDSQYAEVHDGRAYYVQGAAGTKTVWVSEAPGFGGLSDGEYGYEYVSPNSYFTISDPSADSDIGISAIRSFSGRLCVWTPTRMFGVETSNIASGLPGIYPVEGAVGCASHWCVVESKPLPEVGGGLLFYPHPMGGLYGFDGTRSTPIDYDGIKGYLEGFSQVTWVNPDEPPSNPALLWYYASAVISPAEDAVILSAPLRTGVRECYVWNFNEGTWARWDIGGGPWFSGRTIAADTLPYYPGPYFASGQVVMQLRDGRSDNGMPIPWGVTTGALGGGFTNRLWRHGGWETRPKGLTGATSAGSVDLSGVFDGVEGASATYTFEDSGEQFAPFQLDRRARFTQLTVDGEMAETSGFSGGFSDGYQAATRTDHRILLGYTVDCDQVGVRNRSLRAD